jgi:hypothetical protein
MTMMLGPSKTVLSGEAEGSKPPADQVAATESPSANGHHNGADASSPKPADSADASSPKPADSAASSAKPADSAASSAKPADSAGSSSPEPANGAGPGEPETEAEPSVEPAASDAPA